MASRRFLVSEPAQSREILVLAGPTAVGKSSLAVEVARRVGGEIVSADSRQLYRGLDIGTATPSSEEQQGVRHHLIDTVDPEIRVSAGLFLEQTTNAITDIESRRHPVIVVGGSTLYVEGLVKGLADLPPVPPDLEATLQTEVSRAGGPERLYRELAEADPEAAATLDPTKSHRLVRLLGVVRSTGQPVSRAWQEQGAAPFRTRLVVLDRPRDELYARIDARVDRMLERGLVEEVRALSARGAAVRPTLEATIGYRELLPVLDGRQSLEDAVVLIKRNSRRYAKRQLTWYRRFPDALWLDAGETTADHVLDAVAPWPAPLDA